MEIKFKTVNESDAEFLYDLLKEREGHVNISHKSLPEWDEHLQFIKSEPYLKWEIILSQNKQVGNIYLTNRNEIGIFIKKEFQYKGIGSAALKQFMKKSGQKRFLANINPTNYKSIQFFGKNGFSHIISTFQNKIEDI
tara:strand:- start:4811 stop:5224 length:414 start_codon:yes stop_codon:yes gene_type:complete